MLRVGERSSTLIRSALIRIAARKLPRCSHSFSTYTAQKNNEEHHNHHHQRAPQLPLWVRIKGFITFTLSGTLVLGGIGLSGVVLYLITSELFSPSGDTQLFNRAVTMVQSDAKVREMLQCTDEGSRERLKAYGEIASADRWTRNRPIVSMKKTDRENKQHYYMRFHLESKKKRALVHIEAKESTEKYVPDFVCVYVDVPGEQRHYLIKPKTNAKSSFTNKSLFGLVWGKREDNNEN